jgi:SAM-dependent methyltransferase
MALMDELAFARAHLLPPPARVLEVGCGDGRLARELHELGYRVTAIDPNAPEGAIFRTISLEEFEMTDAFDAVIAIRALHHIADLGGALSKVRSVLAPQGRMIVVEHAPDRFDEPTARWYLEKHRATHPGAPTSLEACLAEWTAEHAGLHDSTVLLQELNRRFTQRYFAWTPYLYGELGKGVEHEERRLVGTGRIRATGFSYVGARSGAGSAPRR